MADENGCMTGLCVSDCTRCPALVESRSRIVNGTGPTDAELVIVGEAPGATEDEEGEPFVGRSGALLDEALAGAGVDREQVRISNCVRCRPPDNRDPRTDELGHCREWLLEELRRIDPAVVVPVGKVPASHLLERDVAVTAEAGRVERIDLAGRSRDVVICVHPAAVLYDRTNEERLASALEKAVDRAGIGPGGRTQRRLGDF